MQCFHNALILVLILLGFTLNSSRNYYHVLNGPPEWPQLNCNLRFNLLRKTSFNTQLKQFSSLYISRHTINFVNNWLISSVVNDCDRKCVHCFVHDSLNACFFSPSFSIPFCVLSTKLRRFFHVVITMNVIYIVWIQESIHRIPSGDAILYSNFVWFYSFFDGLFLSFYFYFYFYMALRGIGQV